MEQMATLPSMGFCERGHGHSFLDWLFKIAVRSRNSFLGGSGFVSLMLVTFKIKTKRGPQVSSPWTRVTS